MPQELLFIREVARQTGVSVDTIRHYERKGLLGSVERDASGYRRYAAGVPHRVRVVRAALAFGFTLDELARIFRQRDAGRPPCQGVRALAAEKLHAIEREIADLGKLRDALQQLVGSWDLTLGQTPPGSFAHLLDGLVTDEA